MKSSHFAQCAVLAALLCAAPRTPFAQVIPRPAPNELPVPTKVIAHQWESEAFSGDALHSLALWSGPDGRTRLYVSATEKDIVHVLDGDNGRTLGRIGGTGSLAGQLRQPSGVAVHGDLLFVVERGNRRVQVFTLPEEIPLLSFGEADLLKPQRITIVPSDGTFQVYLIDTQEVSADHPEALPLLTGLVRQYELEQRDGKVGVRFVNTFGTTGEDGTLWIPRDIHADPQQRLLFLSDESVIKVFTLEGDHTASVTTAGASNGVAIVESPEAPLGGFLIVSERGVEDTPLRVFSREGSRPVGSITARPPLRSTGGVHVHNGTLPSFGGAALFVVHDDRMVRAYAVREFLREGILQSDGLVTETEPPLERE